MASDNGSTVLLNETESTTNSRPLIVVVVRGSVTKKDWENNFRTQFVPQDNRFDALKEEISDNLSSYIEVLELPADSDPIILVTGHSIKENVVVYQPQTEYVYTFDMDFGGLTPVAQEDGSYKLVDSAKPEETVFVLAAPYMYDANGEESYEVEMSLTQNGGNYLLTLTADEEWINSSETTLPVTINQTENYKFDDVFVIDGLFANSPRVKKELRVGKNLTNITRTYIKIAEPHNIPYGSKINYAKLILKNKNYYQAPLQDNIDIKLYDCSNVATWSATSVTWNNQPFGNTAGSYSSYNADLLCTVPATDNEGSDYEFNIKTAVENWLETGTNKGFMLASSDESSKTQIDFYSSRADVYQPVIRVNYEEPYLSLTEWVPNQNADTSPAITVSSTKNWTASANQSWISVSPSGGADGDSFTISVTENPNASARTGEVTVMAGTSKIGTVEVTQTGSDPFLSVSNTDLYFKPDEESITQAVTVNANEGWSFSQEEFPSNEEVWFTVNKTDNNKLTFELLEANSTFNARSATVTVTTDSGLEEEITITQFDEVSLYFNKIKPDRSASRKSSSEYNHPLAQWAMALSYAAYNPVEYEAIPGIPSSFMQEPYDVETKTAKFELESMGFDATSYNYDGGYLGYAAHTIGHRNIIVENNQEKGEDNNDTSITLTTVLSTGSWVDTNLSGVGSDAGQIDRISIESVGSIPEIDEALSETESTDNSRTLIVVSIRGSVTPLDWAMDLISQIDREIFSFEAGCREIIESLNAYKLLYDEEINNPIILVTGHSLGAAVANLVANELNAGTSSDDVYAYTFATPNTVNLAGGKQAVLYTNVFNILNNNDAVPHFPVDKFGTEWARHGQDFHITMPWIHSGIGLFDTDLLGAFGHGMPTYYAWMNNLPGTLGKAAEDITAADIENMSVDYAVGFGALLFKVLCPVTVTLYDTDGNIIPFESQQNNAEYPKISNTGIVSWITDDGGKMFLIPYGAEDIEARITAYDYGTMTLTVEQPGIGEPLDSKTYNNVNLFPGRTFEVVIPEDTEEVSIGNVSLVEVDENGDTIGEITELDSYLKSVTVDDPEVTYGTVSTFTVVTDKDAVKIRFTYRETGVTLTLERGNALVTNLVEDGDTLIWTVQRVFRTGAHTFDVSVKMGSTWYVTENAIALTVNTN